MKTVFPALVLTTLSLAGKAQDTQDLLSTESDPFYAGKPPATTNDGAAHCKELRRQMAELMGSPQRRHAVSQRYQLECTPARQMPGQPGLQ